jgi:parallel beta-helix repeat protein
MVVKLENIGAGDFQARLAIAASTVADGTVVDCTFYTGTQTINKTIVVSKSATFVFGNSIINGTLPANNHMFHIVAPNVRFQGDYEVGVQNLTATTSTNTSTKPKFVMTEKGSGYHFYCSHTTKTGPTYNWASASGFSLHNLELTGITSEYTQDGSGNPVYSVPGAGGVFITEGNPGISGSNIANVRLTDLTINRVRFSGILLYGAIASTISNTTVNAAAGHGIFVSGSSTSVEIDTCKVTNSGFAGIIHQNSTYCSVRSCISEQNGLGYWLRSSNNVTLEACGAEKGFAKPKTPASFGNILYNSIGTIVLSEVGNDHTDFIKGTSYFTSGGSYNTYESCYSKNPGNTTTSYLDKRTTHFGFLGTTEKCRVIAPGIFNFGVVKYNYRIESLGVSAPSDLFINAPVVSYDPSNPTESPDNPTQQTATVLDQGTGNVFKLAVDKISFNSTDLEVVKSDARVSVNRKKVDGMFVVPAYASEPALPGEWSGAVYFNTTNNTLYMRDDGIWYSTCCTPPTPYNPTPIVLPPYSTPIDLTPTGPTPPPGGGGSGTGGGSGSGGGTGGSGSGNGGAGSSGDDCCSTYIATLNVYSVAPTAYENCLAGIPYIWTTAIAPSPGDPVYEELLANSYTLVYNASTCGDGLPRIDTWVADATSYVPQVGQYYGGVPDGFYGVWQNPTWGGLWYQIVNSLVVTIGGCGYGIGNGVVVTGDPGDLAIEPPNGWLNGGSFDIPFIPSNCIPAFISPGTCNFPNSSINFICSASFGMAVPISIADSISAVFINNYIYYKQPNIGQGSISNGTNFNDTVIAGVGVNTLSTIYGALRIFNKESGAGNSINFDNVLIIPPYSTNFDLCSMLVDSTELNIYISRVTSPAVSTNTYTETTYDQAPSITRYNTLSGNTGVSNYESTINHNLDFSTVTCMRQSSITNLIFYSTLAYPDSNSTSRYMAMIFRSTDLSYYDHKEFEITTAFQYRPVDSALYSITITGITYPTIAIDDSSYYFDDINERLFVPTRNYTVASSTNISNRYLVLNYDDNSIDYFDPNSINPFIPSLGVKFYTDPSLDLVYTLDVLRGIVTAFDPANTSVIVDLWQLEDPVYQPETECIFKSFAIRKTASNKIICYYITTAVNTIAPGNPVITVGSDAAVYDTKVCATRLINGGTTGTIYSGYVNAPYGYPGLAPRVKLTQEDPESVYIVGDTVFKMCNLINGE